MNHQNRERDLELQTIAWQTALLMNSTGNYKKRIAPKDLYKSPYDEDGEEKKKEAGTSDALKGETREERLEEKNKKLASLKAGFGK